MLIHKLSLAACLLTGAALWAAAPAPSAPAATDDGARPSLELIKQLVGGEWVRVDADGNLTDEVVSRFRLTAGGSAVVETEFPGSEKEMLTVYHQDGEDLVLTHYCMLGNQPRMRALPQKQRDELSFEFVGVGNVESENEKHMHQATMTWIDEDHIRTKWDMFENGAVVYTADFELARRR